MLLCDGNIAFGSEPWRIPDAADIATIDPKLTTPDQAEGFRSFSRDPETLARPWTIPGTAGLEHRIGGLERADQTGNSSYEPDNHELMTRLREEKVKRIADSYAPTQVDGDASGELLLISWGSPYGPVTSAARRYRKHGAKIGHVHLTNLWPLPNDLGEILSRFERILIPENNTGQLRTIIRSKYLVDAKGFNQVRGLPFKVADIEAAIHAALEQ
jgi:2-oxoglutarate ferredoxin oxidoreductase subunit alpha